MKNFIFGFLFGGAVGAGVTYFVMKEKNKKDLEEEVKEIKDSCEDTIVKIREYYAETVPEKADVIKEDPSDIVKKYHDEAGRYNTESKIDPAESEHPTEDAPEEYYEELSDEEKERRAVAEGMLADVYDKMNRDKAPEIISSDEYGAAPGFETEECTYYVEDLTFCDEGELIIDNEIRMFGTCVDEWKENHEMVDPIFIRNYGMNTDYKIDKMFCKCPRFARVNHDGGAK